jgi:hypothetical protein
MFVLLVVLVLVVSKSFDRFVNVVHGSTLPCEEDKIPTSFEMSQARSDGSLETFDSTQQTFDQSLQHRNRLHGWTNPPRQGRFLPVHIYINIYIYIYIYIYTYIDHG